MNDTHLGNNGIGAVKTDSQVSTAQHNRRVAFYAAARGPFIGLLRLNLWGLASILKKTAFEVDKATTDSQSAPNYWWDVQARWRNAWWNLGGTWSKFVSAVNAGAKKKPILVFLAPRNIKDKLKAKGIRGIKEVGIGSLEATLTAAAAVIAALTPLILSTISVSKKSDTASQSPIFVTEDGTPYTGDDTGKKEDGFLTDSEGQLTTAGYGLIGVAVMAALILATKPLPKKRKK